MSTETILLIVSIATLTVAVATFCYTAGSAICVRVGRLWVRHIIQPELRRASERYVCQRAFLNTMERLDVVLIPMSPVADLSSSRPKVADPLYLMTKAFWPANCPLARTVMRDAIQDAVDDGLVAMTPRFFDSCHDFPRPWMNLKEWKITPAGQAFVRCNRLPPTGDVIQTKVEAFARYYEDVACMNRSMQAIWT